LLRAGKSPFHILSPCASSENYPNGVFAGNMGNMVFSDAMHRMLSRPSVEVVVNSYLGERSGVTPAYLERINAEFDHFVVPLANAFRPTFLSNLETLTDTIRGLRIPVTVTGVGVGEKAESFANEEVKRAVQRFMAAVLERSARVGVRGEITRQYLSTLGYGDAHVQVIGCPSLFRYGADLQIEKSNEGVGHDDPIAINMRQVASLNAMDESAIRHAKRYSKLVYIGQNIVDLRLLLTGEQGHGSDLSVSARDRLFYEENRMLAFVDSRTWIDFLRTVRFTFGTRIHGNIAALVAGSPAVVLVSGLRTQEIADYHHIPSRPVADAAELDATELYETADFTAFNTKHRENFATFSNFLHENDLGTVFDAGQGNPAYDERLASLPLPGPVRPVRGARGTNGLLKKLARRWQHTAYHYTAPVPHVPKSVLGTVGATVARGLISKKSALRRNPAD
jgi:polysaccharide pyruvyl transferase WcaK-like protein